MSESTLRPVREPALPWLVRVLGGKWRDYARSFRMTWGELSFGKPGWALALHLYDDPPHFTLQLHVWRLFNAYIRLPFLRRFAHEPDEIMETWGLSYDADCGSLFLRWGNHCKIVDVPWRDWGSCFRHEVLRADGSWVPYVPDWEHDKEPDGRHTETHPYRYLLRSGKTQECAATIYVDRMTWRLRWLRWTPRFERAKTCINVAFSAEVGEQSGSWKGGTIGCSYEMRVDETPLQCLRRMEQERRFT